MALVACRNTYCCADSVVYATATIKTSLGNRSAWALAGNKWLTGRARHGHTGQRGRKAQNRHRIGHICRAVLSMSRQRSEINGHGQHFAGAMRRNCRAELAWCRRNASRQAPLQRLENQSRSSMVLQIPVDVARRRSSLVGVLTKAAVSGAGTRSVAGTHAGTQARRRASGQAARDVPAEDRELLEPAGAGHEQARRKVQRNMAALLEGNNRARPRASEVACQVRRGPVAASGRRAHAAAALVRPRDGRR